VTRRATPSGRSVEGMRRPVELRTGVCPVIRERTGAACTSDPMPQIVLEEFNLEAAERRLCAEALAHGGGIVGGARLLGITRHALKRRIVKLKIAWTRGERPAPTASPGRQV
jgi:hypothetical protein